MLPWGLGTVSLNPNAHRVEKICLFPVYWSQPPEKSVGICGTIVVLSKAVLPICKTRQHHDMAVPDLARDSSDVTQT